MKLLWRNMHGVMAHSAEEVSVKLGVSLEYAEIMVPAMIIYRVFIEELGGQTMWLPGTHLNDGVAMITQSGIS